MACMLLVIFTGCEKFTDVDPKGKNLLEEVAHLDQLLNFQFGGFQELEMNNLSVLINDRYPIITDVPNTISAPIKTLASVLLTWDEEGKRAALTASDGIYEECYSIIGKVANPVLLKVDEAVGDREMAARLKAEAYVLRAYFHYLLVNVYAKAYDPATAATDGGVPYAREDDVLAVPNRKRSVQEVYDFILEDLEAAFALNSLLDKPRNLMRVGKAFAHAVEAMVRMSMRDFEGAERAAMASLAIRGTLEDHRECLILDYDWETNELGMFFSRPRLQCAEDLFFAGAVSLLICALTPEMSAAFEEESIFHNTVGKDNWYGEVLYGLPIEVLLADAVYLNSCGLTTVDMYLVQAECRLRDGDLTGAMEILNGIREMRVDPYTPVVAANVADAFALLKNITRTETWFGPKHFIALKRWNAEDAYKETIRKTLLDVDYELHPDSPLWIFPFPRNATGNNPNLIQNY